MERSDCGVIDPEIMEPVRPNTVCWDMSSTLRSPFFWFLAGATAAWVGIYLLNKPRK
jgi:hypothetical protein